MSKFNFLTLLMLSLCLSASAQDIPDYGFNKVRIVLDTKVVQAETLPLKSKPSIDIARQYHWYASNVIHATQGGFSGRLLNGKYTEYYANKNLSVQGYFNAGLQDGAWKSWTENGILTQLYTWKKGIKSGKFFLADNTGKLLQKGSYRDGLLEGSVTVYGKDGNPSVIRYKNGIAREPDSSGFWKRINVFKKKKSHA